jgi:hypothetical protein
MRLLQERALREGEIEMWRAHAARDLATRAAKAAAAAAPPPDPDAARRIDGMAERARAEPRPGPRIRSLW